MIIRPIETNYRGYRFRSRLEARWAIFFDTAKIRWLYEHQGYVVNDRPYLPDFYLPEFDYFFEVKPTSDYDLVFLQQFACEIGKFVVVAEGGIPDPEEWNCESNIQLRVLSHHRKEADMDMASDVAWGFHDMFLQCDSCGHTSIMNEAYSTMKDNCSACQDSGSRLMPLSSALAAARSARFEHGEYGVRPSYSRKRTIVDRLH